MAICPPAHLPARRVRFTTYRSRAALLLTNVRLLLKGSPLRNFVTAFLLLLAAENAIAASPWILVYTGPGMSMYLNKEGIYRTNGTTKMWRLSDHHKPIPWPFGERKTSPKQILSAVSLDEYDCTERRVRNLSTANYESHMGNGRLVYATDGPAEWSYVRPGVVAVDNLKVACDQDGVP